MPVVKRIVCLANSRKTSGTCVAGKEQAQHGFGSWIRPVSARPTEEVSEHERQYQDGSDPQVLNIMDVPLLHPNPKSHQSENWLLDPDHNWVREGQATWDDLEAIADGPETLWVNGSRTGKGLNDHVALAAAELLSNSLYLLRLEDLNLKVFASSEYFGDPKRRVQASFSSRGVDYRLWVTDPVVEQKYLKGQDGEFPIGRCFATVSLGEPHEDGYCYKLVAALIIPQKKHK